MRAASARSTESTQFRSRTRVISSALARRCLSSFTACSVAALTIYDMCKSADRSMVIGDIALWEKTGGRSGNYRRAPSLDDDDLGL